MIYRVTGYEGAGCTLNLIAQGVVWTDTWVSPPAEGFAATLEEAKAECAERRKGPIVWRPIQWVARGHGVEVEIEFRLDYRRFQWKVCREGRIGHTANEWGWIDLGGWANTLKKAKEAVETVVGSLPPIFGAIGLAIPGRKRKGESPCDSE